MKRLVIRLSALSVVVVLGLIAIAQARHGFQSTESNSPEAVAESQLPANAPRAIRAETDDEISEVNPLRSRAALENSGGQVPTRYGSLPNRSSGGSDSNIPPAGVVLAAHQSGTPTQAPTRDSQVVQAGGEGSASLRYGELRSVVKHNEPEAEPMRMPGGQSNTPPNRADFAGPASSAPSHGARTEPAPLMVDEPLPIEPARSTPMEDAQPLPSRVASRIDDARPIHSDPRESSQPIEAPRQLERAPADFSESRLASSSQYEAPGYPAQDNTHGGDNSSLRRSSDPSMQGNFSMPAASATASAGVAGSGRPGPRELEGAQAPSLTLEKTAPAEIQVGKACTFTVRVRNVGQAAAHEVEIRDAVPQGTRLVSTSPQADQRPDGQLIWSLGTLEGGKDTTVEMVLMPTDEGEIGSVASVRFEAQASVRTTATRPQLALRTTAKDKVMIGETIAVSIELSNPGSGAATGVMLLENVPQHLEHPAGERLEFEVGTLAPGETREMELVLTAQQAGQVQNLLIARADANLEAQSTSEFEVIAPALAVAVDGPKRRYLEREATYVVSVDNPGTASAKDVVLTSYLPRGMKFVSANNAGQYDAQTHTVSWGLAELPAQEVGAVELVAVPTEAGDHEIRVEGRAAQGLADRAEQSVQVEGLAAILFEVIDVEDPIEVGGETAYEIRVVNQGSKASSNVAVAIMLPPDMVAIDASGPTRHAIEQGRVVFAPLSKLAPKADTTYTIKVQANRPGDQRIRVQVVTDDLRTPVTKEESTRVYSDQ